MKCSCFSCGYSHEQFKALLASIEAAPTHETEQADLLRGARVALTIDDLFLWKGLPWADGYSPFSVAEEFTQVFSRLGLEGVYAFSATAPAVADNSLFKVFDHWLAAGHQVANHTHYHSNLNWVSPDNYIRDIELGERDASVWIEASGTKYFRYGQDGWGNTAEKYRQIQAYLARNHYTAAPIGAWFYDTEFIAPHLRCLRCGDEEALEVVRNAYIRTAVQQLRSHARLAQATIGRVPSLIFLMHATPMAQDCSERLLETLLGLGVEFISLDEAMKDPFNSTAPGLITDRFYNQTQKWAAAKDLFLEDCPPAVLDDLDRIHAQSGPTTPQMMTGIFRPIAAEVGGVYSPKKY